jgi:hypothetical protein
VQNSQGKEKKSGCTYASCEDGKEKKSACVCIVRRFMKTSISGSLHRPTDRRLHCAGMCVGYGLPRSGARHRALTQTIGNARGLNINSPRSAEAHTQDLRFRRHQQRDDPKSARGLDNNFASDRDCDSTTTTRLHHRRLRPADHGTPDKS